MSLKQASITSEPGQLSIDNFAVGREQLPAHRAREFVEEYHYSGGLGNAAMCWGCYDDASGALMGVIAFQTPISENTRASVFEDVGKNHGQHLHPNNICDCGRDGLNDIHGYREHVTELHRMAIRPEAPQNTATWFISRALDRLKDHKPKYWAVISFADATEGHDGTVYQAANADYYGTSRPRTQWVDKNGTLRAARQCGENIRSEQADERGWEPSRRDVKHRYVFWTPGSYETKQDYREMAKIAFQEYPQ